MASGNIWTRDEDEQLRALWGEGLSTAKIGVKMGKSKNSIVGRAHRLELTRRESPIKAKRQLGPMRKPKVTLQPLAASGWREPKTRPVTAKTLMGRAAAKVTLAVVEAPAPRAAPQRPAATFNARCRFPLWGNERPAPGEHRFCDAPVIGRADGVPLSYCGAHAARCFTSHAAYGYALPAARDVAA